jgi:hypothetical protein
MTSDEMSERVEKFFREANQLQWQKNHDYHPEGIAFLEILRTCAETRMTVEQDLWARVRKQYIALRTYVIDGRVESEPPRSRMMDITVYMGMLAFWEDNKQRIVFDAIDFITSQQCQFHMMDCGVCDRCEFLNWLKSYADKYRTT